MKASICDAGNAGHLGEAHEHLAKARAMLDQIDAELRHFLSDAFDLKTVADYGVGADAVVSPEEARWRWRRPRASSPASRKFWRSAFN